MKITVGQINNRLEQLNRELDLLYAVACLKAPPFFTQSYILQTRSKTAKASFDRLVAAKVIKACADKTYCVNLEGYMIFKYGSYKAE